MSHPSTASFTDFDTGHTHKLRLTLTNISYTVNRCSLLGMTPELRDFVTVDFCPTGAVSTGMTCHAMVTFEPKVCVCVCVCVCLGVCVTSCMCITCISGFLPHSLPSSLPPSLPPQLNADLHGEILFLSQTLPFSVPVHCTSKKCVVSVDMPQVDCGSVCVGETSRRIITLRNDGALETDFIFHHLAADNQVISVYICSQISSAIFK